MGDRYRGSERVSMMRSAGPMAAPSRRLDYGRPRDMSKSGIIQSPALASANAISSIPTSPAHSWPLASTPLHRPSTPPPHHLYAHCPLSSHPPKRRRIASSVHSDQFSETGNSSISTPSRLRRVRGHLNLSIDVSPPAHSSLLSPYFSPPPSASTLSGSISSFFLRNYADHSNSSTSLPFTEPIPSYYWNSANFTVGAGRKSMASSNHSALKAAGFTRPQPIADLLTPEPSPEGENFGPDVTTDAIKARQSFVESSAPTKRLPHPVPTGTPIMSPAPHQARFRSTSSDFDLNSLSLSKFPQPPFVVSTPPESRTSSGSRPVPAKSVFADLESAHASIAGGNSPKLWSDNLQVFPSLLVIVYFDQDANAQFSEPPCTPTRPLFSDKAGEPTTPTWRYPHSFDGRGRASFPTSRAVVATDEAQLSPVTSGPKSLFDPTRQSNPYRGNNLAALPLGQPAITFGGSGFQTPDRARTNSHLHEASNGTAAGGDSRSLQSGCLNDEGHLGITLVDYENDGDDEGTPQSSANDFAQFHFDTLPSNGVDGNQAYGHQRLLRDTSRDLRFQEFMNSSSKPITARKMTGPPDSFVSQVLSYTDTGALLHLNESAWTPSTPDASNSRLRAELTQLRPRDQATGLLPFTPLGDGQEQLSPDYGSSELATPPRVLRRLRGRSNLRPVRLPSFTRSESDYSDHSSRAFSPGQTPFDLSESMFQDGHENIPLNDLSPDPQYARDIVGLAQQSYGQNRDLQDAGPGPTLYESPAVFDGQIVLGSPNTPIYNQSASPYHPFYTQSISPTSLRRSDRTSPWDVRDDIGLIAGTSERNAHVFVLEPSGNVEEHIPDFRSRPSSRPPTAYNFGNAFPRVQCETHRASVDIVDHASTDDDTLNEVSRSFSFAESIPLRTETSPGNGKGGAGMPQVHFQPHELLGGARELTAAEQKDLHETSVLLRATRSFHRGAEAEVPRFGRKPFYGLFPVPSMNRNSGRRPLLPMHRSSGAVLRSSPSRTCAVPAFAPARLGAFDAGGRQLRSRPRTFGRGDVPRPLALPLKVSRQYDQTGDKDANKTLRCSVATIDMLTPKTYLHRFADSTCDGPHLTERRPTRKLNLHARRDVASQQRLLSWTFFTLFCLFPPFLLIFAWPGGWGDQIVAWKTSSRCESILGATRVASYVVGALCVVAALIGAALGVYISTKHGIA